MKELGPALVNAPEARLRQEAGKHEIEADGTVAAVPISMKT